MIIKKIVAPVLYADIGQKYLLLIFQKVINSSS